MFFTSHAFPCLPALPAVAAGIFVAVVTAAGYPGKPERYAARLRGLLDGMRERRSPKQVPPRGGRAL